MSHLKLIIIVASIFAAVTVAYFVSKGTIYNESKCPNSTNYGTPIDYSAKSFLSTISYEFYDFEKEEWTSDSCLTPGKYKVRGVSKRSFGRLEYTDEYEFEVLPRKISININDFAIYGSDPEFYADTAYGDRVICQKFIYSHQKSIKTNVSADINSIYIVNENGDDVTNRYVVETPTSILQILPKPITIDIPNTEKIYDGQPISSSDYNISFGEFVSGDIASLSFDKMLINVGELQNTPSVSVSDEFGNDLSSLYDITLNVGVLKVIPRPLEVTTGSTTTVYDGKEHYNNDINIVGLAEGQTVGASFSSSREKYAGRYVNSTTVTVFDEKGNNTTENYEINYNFGILEITKRPLMIVTKNVFRTYTGEAISDRSYEAYGLADNQIFFATPAERTDVGSTLNELYDLQVISTDSVSSYENLIDNYDVTTDYGTLTVTPKRIVIAPAPEELTYNGSPQTPLSTPNAIGLVEGHTLSAYTLIGERCEVGSSTTVIEEGSVIIKDISQRDVTHNYDIKLQSGTLTVKERLVWIESGSASKKYDGEPLVCSEVFVSESSPYQMVNGHYLTVDSISGEQTKVGSSKNIFSLETIRFYDQNGNDVSHNYTVDHALYGELTVKSLATITVTTGSSTRVYNGKTLKNEEFSYTVSGGDLMPGHRVSLDSFSTLFNAGSTPNSATVKVVDKDGKNATHLYSIETNWGTLTVTPVKITVYSSSESFEYDGTEHRSIYVTTSKDLVGSDSLFVSEFTSATNVGVYTNEVKVIIYSGSPTSIMNNVTGNYDISYEYGEIEITKRTLYASPGEAFYTYSGTPAVFPDQIESEGLVSSHFIICDYLYEPITNVGSTLVDISTETFGVYYSDGYDTYNVSDNYSIVFSSGLLTVTPRPIKVSSSSMTKHYDGYPLTSPIITSTDIVYGHYIVSWITGSQTEVGSSLNTYDHEFVVIYDSNGNKVTKNYSIEEYREGTLTVMSTTKINVSTPDASKYFDGTPLTCEEYTLEIIGELEEGDEISIQVTESITNVGSTINKATVKIVDANGNDRTYLYEVSQNFGTLSVLSAKEQKPHLTICPEFVYKEYDGEPLYATHDIVMNDELNALLDLGYYYDISVSGSQTEPGEGISSIIRFRLYDPNGDCVNHYFDIEYQNGRICVYEKTIEIVLYQLQKFYDGTPLFYEDGDYRINDLQDGINLDIDIMISLTDVGSISLSELNSNSQEYVDFKITDDSGEDISDKYSIIFCSPREMDNYVPITIEKSTIELSSPSVTDEYNGVPLSDNRVYVSKGNLAASDTLTANASGTIDHVGSITNTIDRSSVKITNSLGEDVTDNYDIIFKDGTLTLS